MAWTEEDRERMLAAGRRADPAPGRLYATCAQSRRAPGKFLGALSYQPDGARFGHGGQRLQWLCGHDHDGRDGARACASGELARRVPASGSSQDRVYTQRNRDYPDDTDICFERGNGTTVVRLTPADLPKLLAAAGGLAPGLEELRARAAALTSAALGEAAPDVADWALRSTRLVDYAYIAGQVDFSAGNGRRAALDYLAGKLEEARRDFEPACGEIGPGPDVLALERVIAMLDGA
jgi:hypothetical protein